ncbi:MAG: helix-turn-helix domain-containing protein [Rikenellaceae bacterium]|nr:helix-turn-helix domain-containing protein [Rikenellaceae bacterium]
MDKKRSSIYKAPEVYSIEDEVVFSRVDHRVDVELLHSLNTVYLPSHRNAVMIFVLLTSGKIEALTDTLAVCEADGNNFMCIPMTGRTMKMTVSCDTSGYMLMISKRFADNMIKGRKILSIPQIMSMRHYRTVKFSGDDLHVVRKCLDEIENRFSDDKNLFCAELTRMAIMTFLYENINIILTHGKIVPEKSVYDRKERMVARFVELLVADIEEYHEVGYYADRLCVTPHYLSKVLKSVLNKSAREIIDGVLIERAIAILREPDSTAQQVADRLKFSDQSSFGKFFKRHVGVSPMKFKRGGA